MIPYSHTIRVYRPYVYDGSEARGDDGQPLVAQDDTLVYSGRCDFQEMSFDAIHRFQGDESRRANGDVFFPEEEYPATFNLEDKVEIDADFSTKTGFIVHVSDFERSLKVRLD